ncbi:L,D-transpeptidase [Streptomyces chiangmaiensis]|uniref:L,D-transpeptidase n=1 Tax=Streptomyces chiangmaiensis TaxID=766497 RepID=A0ABU7FFH4_9ACTN|nr:L,D-transpeptidase [Streptomyces chiangmaiensis]MED7822896.1 L,D-transpeptidase [Streptomyces chiangmaiensis]
MGALTVVLTLVAGPARADSAGHVTTIDAATHRMTVTDHDRTVMTFPVSFGKPGFPTPSGTFHVLGKDAVVKMTSCSARITCDPGNPNYYVLTVHWAVRLTSGGVFVHAAPWNSAVGRIDISHGCIHLNTADAQRFYAFSRVGDTVIVKNTGSVRGGPSGP